MQPFQLSDVLLLKKVGKKLKIRGTPKRCLEYILPSSMGIYMYIYQRAYIYIYIYELRTKLLVWGICHQQISWSPIGFQGFVCSGHQHQGRSMQFTLWGDLICHMIEKIEGTVLHGKWIAGELVKMPEIFLRAGSSVRTGSRRAGVGTTAALTCL